MRIENNTRWRTDHLRAIVVSVLQDVLDAEKRKQTLVVFDTARSSKISGFAYYGMMFRYHKGPYWLMHIRVPSPYGLRARIIAKWTEQNPLGSLSKPVIMDRVQLAAVIAHETGHFGGRRNRDLRDSHIHGINEHALRRFSWAAGMPLDAGG